MSASPQAASRPSDRRSHDSRAERDAIIAHARSAAPWSFLPAGTRWIRANGPDPDISPLVAGAFARAGLRTAAIETIEEAERPGTPLRAADSIRRLAEGLPDDRVPIEVRVRTARANLDALADRGVTIDAGMFEGWTRATAAEEWFRAADGNIARRRGGAWTRLGDERGPVAAMRAGAGGIDPASRKPWYVQGVGPPWALVRLAELLPPQADGYRAPITVVEPRADKAFDAMAMLDLRPLIADERIAWFIGPDALARLERSLDSRLAFAISGGVLTIGEPAPDEAAGGVRRVLESLEARQRAELNRLTSVNAAAYAGRDAAWWRTRYEEARAGSAEPLRVLIPTTRYSTYVRHASADIAAAFDAAGCRAMVLEEPDDSTVFSACAAGQAVESFRPDLIVLINYTRDAMGPAVPRNIPFVCWIQDAMRHLFQPRTGASLGELDFIVGHAHQDLFDRCGYPRRRTLSTAVPASERKFHPGPADPALRRRFECDIAYVGNQSETPEACRDRFIHEARAAGPDNAMIPVIEALYPACRRIGTGVWKTCPLPALRAAVESAVRTVARREPDPAMIVEIMNSIAMPLAERCLRHEMLEWAASIARRRGWRFRLYGRGWESHPSLREFAAGAVPHGEELRACYQSAVAHLHGSLHGWMHQRVFECALSGGLPLVRALRDHLDLLHWHTQSSIAESRPALHRIEGIPFTEAAWVDTADHWQAMRMEAILQRLGIPPYYPGKYYVGQEILNNPWHHCTDEAYIRAIECLFALFDDAFFPDEPGLERLVGYARADAERRQAVASSIARRVRADVTYERVVSRVLDLVARGSVPG